MPIYTQTPPADVSRALDTMRNLVHPKDDALGGAVADIQRDPSAHSPHMIQTFDLRDLVNSNDLPQPIDVGWRFLTTTTDGRKISAEIDAITDGTVHNQLNQGPFIESTEQVLENLQNEPLVQQGNYTFSVLKIPALYLMAVWLHDQIDQEDRLIPIPPNPDTLISGRLYNLRDFLDALRELARQELSSDL